MTHDVVIIGGGAVGLSAAFHLARDGARVRVIERAHLGSGASTASAAMLEFQADTDRHPDLFQLARLSMDRFPSLESEVRARTGDGFGFERCGILVLALTDDDADFLRRKAARQKAEGLHAEWLSPDEVKARVPQVRADNFGGALLGDDGQINGERFVSGLARAARQAGAAIIEEQGDVTLVPRCGHALARLPSGNELEADVFIVAAGAWSASVVAPLGAALPVNPVKGQLAVYDSPAPDLPMPLYTRHGAYAAPKHDYLLVGTTIENVGFDAATTDEGRAVLAERAERILSGGKALSMRGTVAGLRPATPDLLPVIGFLPGWKDVLLAAGHYRNGMLLAPITGEIVRDLVFSRPPPLDLAPFSAERFVPSAAR